MSEAKLDQYLGELPDTEADLLRQALTDPEVGNVELAHTLCRHGLGIGETSVRRWRAKL